MRIALLDHAVSGWTASQSFTRMLALSLSRACSESGAQLGFLARDRAAAVPGMTVWPVESATYFRGEVTLRKLLGKTRKSDLFASAEALKIDVILPFLDLPITPEGVATIGWIPDFQHYRLPEFFPDTERRRTEERVERVARRSTRLMLSSRAALGDLASVHPPAAVKARAIPFPSLLAFDSSPAELISVRRRYNLPEKFALVSNQIWAHKNHLVVIEALRLTREAMTDIPLVITGLPLDHRDPTNAPISRLLQAVAAVGLQGKITVLGQVRFPELIDLMRAAAVIIQPSKFEGWSTVVQDALALGRPVICSDIPVHREQAPGALGFFECDDPQALARLLLEHWPRLEAGPDSAAEQRALEREREMAAAHGLEVLELCREAAAAR